MNPVVQKYGGSSLSTVDRIRAVARRIAGTHSAGRPVVAVVSARGGSTDELLDVAARTGAVRPGREVDQLLATGECASAALLALALHDLGVPAVSLTGAQAGVRVTGRHGAGFVDSVRADRIRDALSAGRVAVVAGFHGTNADGDVVTLGRGGSDTSAVAIAAELGAGACAIYTDVDGVFSADPRLVPRARVLPSVPAQVMAELAFAGAGVLHARSVELADLSGVDIHVSGAHSTASGTVVTTRAAPVRLETRDPLAAVTHDPDVAHVRLGLGRRPDRSLAGVLDLCAGAAVPVDLLGCDGARVGFTLRRGDLAAVEPALDDLVCAAGGRLSVDMAAGKLSLVGTGLLSRPGIAARMVAALAAAGTPPRRLATSQHRISAVVAGPASEAGVPLLHEHFGLGDPWH